MGRSEGLIADWPWHAIGRFFSHVDRTPSAFDGSALGCWDWIGHVNSCGYGQFKVAGRAVYAHRFSYLLEHGPIPDGKELHHTCERRRCVNPSHLQPVPRTGEHKAEAGRKRQRK